jgi:transcription antitermination factor NusG
VVRLLSASEAPTPIADSEVDAVRLCVERGALMAPHPSISVGSRVRVRSGPFSGVEGIVVRHSNRCKLVLSISLIHQSVALEIGSECLEPITAGVPDYEGQAGFLPTA